MFDFLRRSKKPPENPKEVLKKLEGLEKKNLELVQKIEKLQIESQRHFKKIGFCRYNPFGDVGGDQSFSLALLNEKNDGVLITSLFSREGNRVYAKTIEKGQSSYSLSEEEEEALEKAIAFSNSK